MHHLRLPSFLQYLEMSAKTIYALDHCHLVHRDHYSSRRDLEVFFCAEEQYFHGVLNPFLPAVFLFPLRAGFVASPLTPVNINYEKSRKY